MGIKNFGKFILRLSIFLRVSAYPNKNYENNNKVTVCN